MGDVMHVHINPRQQPTVLDRTVDYVACSDSELVVACQKHEGVAFECLRKRYLYWAISVLHRLAPELRNTDDLVQEIFLRVWHSISHLRNPLAFRGWLKQIVTNCFFDELRRRPKRSLVYNDCPLTSEESQNNAFTQVRDPAAQPDEIAESLEVANDIEPGLVQLAPFARLALLLRLEGMPYAEIARLTHTEVGTVKSRISRARVKLKSMVLPPNDTQMSAHETPICLGGVCTTEWKPVRPIASGIAV